MVTRIALELCSGGPEFKSRQGCFLLFPRQQLTWLPRKLTWDPPADVAVDVAVDPIADVTSGSPIGCCHMVAVPPLMIIFVEGMRAFMAIISNNRLAVSRSNAMIGGVGSKAKLMPVIGSCELAKDVK
ncbi:hypothetical protein Tco_0517056 [Tanacetum coccineum]